MVAVRPAVAVNFLTKGGGDHEESLRRTRPQETFGQGQEPPHHMSPRRRLRHYLTKGGGDHEETLRHARSQETFGQGQTDATHLFMSGCSQSLCVIGSGAPGLTHRPGADVLLPMRRRDQGPAAIT